MISHLSAVLSFLPVPHCLHPAHSLISYFGQSVSKVNSFPCFVLYLSFLSTAMPVFHVAVHSVHSNVTSKQQISFLSLVGKFPQISGHSPWIW